jgi:LEA14-like dessication related protein
MRNFLVLFTVFILISCKSQPQKAEESIEILEPEFDVVSIYIIQADIVVTEFEAVIKIVNPNDFSVELSSINYELYGNSRFWSGGSANDILIIPANSSAETRFTFEMNFINMNRRLLDDVIAMRQVFYRFKGVAQLRPVISNASVFSAAFDCSGYSEVRRKTN